MTEELHVTGRRQRPVLDVLNSPRFVNCAPTAIHAPELGCAIDTGYLIGLGTVDQRMLILVDIDKLMASEDTGQIHKLAV